MNKKYGIAAVIACAIVVGVLIFAYNNTSQTNSTGKSQQSNATNPAGTSQQQNNSNSVTAKTTISGRHFFANVNETVTVKLNP